MANTAPQESEEFHSLKLVGGLGLLTPGWKETSWLRSEPLELNLKRNDDSHLEIVLWMPQDWLYNILLQHLQNSFPGYCDDDLKPAQSHCAALVINKVTL